MKYSHKVLHIADINEIYLCAKYICRLQKWTHNIHVNHNLNLNGTSLIYDVLSLLKKPFNIWIL